MEMERSKDRGDYRYLTVFCSLFFNYILIAGTEIGGLAGGTGGDDEGCMYGLWEYLSCGVSYTSSYCNKYSCWLIIDT